MISRIPAWLRALLGHRIERTDGQPDPAPADFDTLLQRSCDPDGWQREAAVRQLGQLDDARAIAVLLERINDWVPQVHAAAEQALTPYLQPRFAPAFVAVLPLLLRLARRQRGDYAALIQRVYGLLLDTQAELLRDAVLAEDRHLARAAQRLCLEHGLLPRAELVQRSLRSRDVVVRDVAAGLLRELDGEALDQALQLALRDPYMPVRREALQMALRLRPATGVPLAMKFLVDRHAAIRGIAARSLAATGVDVPALLLQQLQPSARPGSHQAQALRLLAALGCRAALPQVEQALRSVLPSVRLAALQAAFGLGHAEPLDLLLQALHDSSPAMVATALRLAVRHKVRPTVAQLLATYGTVNTAHGRRACVKLARLSGKWPRLLLLLELVAMTGAADRELLYGELQHWDLVFNHGYGWPAPELQQAALASWRHCSHQLPPSLRQAIGFSLRPFESAALTAPASRPAAGTAASS